MEKTAVEWLEEQLSYDNGFGVKYPSHNEMAHLNEYFEKAKEMEKQQIIDAFDSGLYDGGENVSNYNLAAEEYYNETFKSE
jgi:hypothetical protein